MCTFRKRTRVRTARTVPVPPAPEHITHEEYNTLVSRLEFNDNMRNNLLTFSFTAVITLIGVILAMEPPVTPTICLLPYLLIIPFAARITYYRVSSAHIDSFLRCFAPENSTFRWGSTEVRERHNCVYGLIAWLVNHEMVMLSLVVSVAYGYQYYIVRGINSFEDLLFALASIPFTIIVFTITHSANNYRALYDLYVPNWYDYKNGFSKEMTAKNKEDTRDVA